jgi:hypothetical protein
MFSAVRENFELRSAFASRKTSPTLGISCRETHYHGSPELPVKENAQT